MCVSILIFYSSSATVFHVLKREREQNLESSLWESVIILSNRQEEWLLALATPKSHPSSFLLNNKLMKKSKIPPPPPLLPPPSPLLLLRLLPPSLHPSVVSHYYSRPEVRRFKIVDLLIPNGLNCVSWFIGL